MKKSAAKFDRLFAETNGYLKDVDYKGLSVLFLKAIEPVQTISIRKDLTFEPLLYDEYISSCQEFQIRFDEGIPMELNSIQLMFRSIFGISYFPELRDELYEPSTFMWRNELKQMATPDGQRILDARMHNCIPVANHELDTAIQASFSGSPLGNELSSDIELAFAYSIPVGQGNELPVQLDMCVSFMM